MVFIQRICRVFVFFHHQSQHRSVFNNTIYWPEIGFDFNRIDNITMLGICIDFVVLIKSVKIN